MKYCHDCAEYTLKYQLALKGLRPDIVSDVHANTFSIVHKSKTYVLSIKDMTITEGVTVATFKDWNLFLVKLIEILNE